MSPKHVKLERFVRELICLSGCLLVMFGGDNFAAFRLGFSIFCASIATFAIEQLIKDW